MSKKKDMDYEERKYIDRLLMLRRQARMTGKDLSSILGKAENYISHIEKYKIDPSLGTLLDILRVFDIMPVEFFHKDFIEYISERDTIERIQAKAKAQIESLHKSK